MTNDQMTDALSKLRTSIDVPPVDAAREQALLAAFDSHWARPQAKVQGFVWRSAAALAVVSVGLNWLVVVHTPRVDPSTVNPDAGLTGFVSWPGAESYPPFESGSLVRVELPVSSLPALGLDAPTAGASVVKAEIVVGQDGLARAVRLVSQ